MKPWSGPGVAKARAWMQNQIISAEQAGEPMICVECSKPVKAGERFVVGHIHPRWSHPHLTWEPSNWRAEHKGCSDRSGKRHADESMKRKALAEAGVFPDEGAPISPRPLPIHTPHPQQTPLDVREGLSWDEICQNAPDWLQPYLEVPEDASPPLWISGVHQEAVGSYGPSAIEWMETNLTERGKPLRLRWWQRLAIVLQLQHREDGSLCWRVIVESGPRRIGKSVRLRGMALWRLANGPEMFEDEQLIVHTGKDLAIVREVLRKAWPWAETQPGWGSKKGMTEPEVSYLQTNRWVARSKDATTGYDCCMALCDEAWDVNPASIDDDLEPSMLERVSPQLLLTSTAHRKATSLMRGRILDALAVDDQETLLLVWAAPPGADPGDPDTWRRASPHWSPDRQRMVASKYAKAQAGQVDPEADDLDPMEGFLAQYLNVWRLRSMVKIERGTPVMTTDAWNAAGGAQTPSTAPDSIAVESWFADGVAVAYAWNTTPPTVTAAVHPDLSSAITQIKASGHRGRVAIGKSLADDPAVRSLGRVKPMQQRTIAAAADLTRHLSEGTRHDDAAALTEQALALRTVPGPDGPVLASKERSDAVKAAAWALQMLASRSGAPRILISSTE